MVDRICPVSLTAIVMLCLLAASADAQSPLDISRFPGLARIFRDVSAGLPQASPEREAAGLFDFEQVALAIAGEATSFTGRTLADYRDAFSRARPIAIVTTSGAAARDDTAYRLHSLGYSPKEIADILTGRITKAALDNAQKMLMLGSRADQASDYLDGEYRRLRDARERAEASARQRLAPKAPQRAFLVPAAIDAFVVRFASVHGVEPALVRAVIACESGWDPDAVSHVGAVGLMQLMPATARELGVDPHDPQQNIEGGIRYLAALLRAFKTVELALVAYNAGPGFAERYARGQVALYGETREFVRRVVDRIQNSEARSPTFRTSRPPLQIPGQPFSGSPPSAAASTAPSLPRPQSNQSRAEQEQRGGLGHRRRGASDLEGPARTSLMHWRPRPGITFS